MISLLIVLSPECACPDVYLDPFSGNSIGGYSNTASIEINTKTRSYAGSAYGLPARERPNVRLLTGAVVHEILFADTATDAAASGVQTSIDGQIQTYTAAKEVIVAAGAFNTPKLLELSGIGSKALLDKHGIATVVDLLGVGGNLQGHLMTGASRTPSRAAQRTSPRPT